MTQASPEADDAFAAAIGDLLARNPEPFFVQVGGYDGVSFDPLRPHVVERNLRGVIIEPIPGYFEKLQALYAGSDRVRPINCAIAEADGERTIWRFKPEAVESGILPPHFGGISSFLMEDLLAETGVLGRSSPNAETTLALRHLVEPVPVQARTLNSLLDELAIRQVDILQIDTEGYDYRVLQLFDFARFRPSVVHYEHQHLNGEDRAAAEGLLESHGYRIHREVYDTLAVQAGAMAHQGEDRVPSPGSQPAPNRLPLMQPGEASVAPLFELAQALRAEARPAQAIAILSHLATLHPGRSDIRLAYAEALGEAGRTLDAMAQLNALKALGVTPELLTAIRTQAETAVGKFNLHLGRGETAEAERHAAALVELLPQNTAMMRAALSCNQALGRPAEALRYAALVAAHEPQNREARTTLADLLHATGDIAQEIEHRVALALAPAPEAHPLLMLRDLHDAAGLILCRPLTERSREQLDELLAAARALEVTAPEGSDWAAWAKHYGVLVEALDMELALAPPKPSPAGKLEMRGADGQALDWKALRARADRLGARCVFFAAADEAYIDLYARWYALSILRYADAPFLAVIHVIGGKGALARIAQTVGIADERVVFTADDFDAGAVTTRIYDAPPKTWTEKPVAHLQSARFQRLGALIEKLERPVFVSDIDLLLQRGVADLLAAHAQADLVLNENEVTFNAGSRITANLLLVNPTPAGRGFAAAVSAYLTKMLSRPQVTRWIDQVALTLGRHNLAVHSPGARIGYFDTRSDINNVMYPSFQDHPFRFLSLYHGFDTASLEGDPRVLGESAVEASAA
jgi:FkbM family methyltransferase